MHGRAPLQPVARDVEGDLLADLHVGEGGGAVDHRGGGYPLWVPRGEGEEMGRGAAAAVHGEAVDLY